MKNIFFNLYEEQVVQVRNVGLALHILQSDQSVLICFQKILNVQFKKFPI